MDTLWFAINAVFPIVILIGLGYYLARLRFFDDAFLKTLNKYVFFVALPVLLFYNIYNIDSILEMDFNIIWIALLGGLLLFFFGLWVVVLLVKETNRKGVVLQCIFRSNFAIIGFTTGNRTWWGRIDCDCINVIGIYHSIFKHTSGIIAYYVYDKWRED